MSVHALTEAERTRASHLQRGQPMQLSLRQGELVGGAAFIVAAVALLELSAPPAGFSWATAAVYVIAIAIAVHVRFDVGTGFTVPVQVVFVPMLFVVPVSVVPLLVPLALALGMVPSVLRRQVSPSWLLTAAGNSWFAMGPAIVLSAFAVHTPDGHWAVLLLALAAQLAVDFAQCTIRDRLHGDLDLRELLNEVRPIYAIDLALSPLGLAVAFSAVQTDNAVAVLLIVPLFGVLRYFSKERDERLSQLNELNDAYQGTALLLGDVVEADDAYTGKHCKSVVRLALEVAEQMGLDADRKRNVEFGALLHDVGKIAVPKAIINKPGALDEREWEIIKTHTIEGQRMLEQIGGFMNEIGRIVRASHERWDGSGYPDGLSGHAIPLEARIVSACDAFNAMTTTRSYRKAMSHPAACEELERCAGSHFDPTVVRVLLNLPSTRADAAAAKVEPASQLHLANPIGQARDESDVMVGVSSPLPVSAPGSIRTQALPRS